MSEADRMSRVNFHRFLCRWLVGAIVVFASATAACAQLNQNCVVGILNRTVQVNPDGTWTLPNIPAGFGLVRARATCVQNGLTTFGQSGLFAIQPNLMNAIPPIQLGATTPVPTSLSIAATTATLNQGGATAQLTVTASYASGPSQDVTAGSTGTQYTVSNSA